MSNKETESSNLKPRIENVIEKRKIDIQITSLVFGIMSIVTLFVMVLPFILGIIGIIVGIISLIKSEGDKKIGVIGIALSLLGVIIESLLFMAYIYA